MYHLKFINETNDPLIIKNHVDSVLNDKTYLASTKMNLLKEERKKLYKIINDSSSNEEKARKQKIDKWRESGWKFTDADDQEPEKKKKNKGRKWTWDTDYAKQNKERDDYANQEEFLWDKNRRELLWDDWDDDKIENKKINGIYDMLKKLNESEKLIIGRKLGMKGSIDVDYFLNERMLNFTKEKIASQFDLEQMKKMIGTNNKEMRRNEIYNKFIKSL